VLLFSGRNREGSAHPAQAILELLLAEAVSADLPPK
jgi:hypothetical protein